MKRTVNELEMILGDAPWELFEGRHTGDLFVRMDDGFGLLGFYMRVGTHFKQPMQVIVADGSFVRMRSARQWADCPLIEIDANNPETCMYPDYGPVGVKPLWMPWPSNGQTTSPYMTVASTVSPLGGTFTIPGAIQGITPSVITTNGSTPPMNSHVQIYQAQLQATQQAGWQGLLGSILGIK